MLFDNFPTINRRTLHTELVLERNRGADADTAESHWHWLYRIGGATAVFSVIIIPIQLIVFSTVPEPDTAVGWFTLFQDNKLVGLLSFEVLFVVNAAIGDVEYLDHILDALPLSQMPQG